MKIELVTTNEPTLSREANIELAAAVIEALASSDEINRILGSSLEINITASDMSLFEVRLQDKEMSRLLAEEAEIERSTRAAHDSESSRRTPSQNAFVGGLAQMAHEDLIKGRYVVCSTECHDNRPAGASRVWHHVNCPNYKGDQVKEPRGDFASGTVV